MPYTVLRLMLCIIWGNRLDICFRLLEPYHNKICYHHEEARERNHNTKQLGQ